MITFKAIVISNNRRKDGTYPVKIRVTFKGVSRRLPTTLVCRQADLTRSLKIKSADILNKTDALIGRMRDAVSTISPFDLEGRDVDWVVAKIRTQLSASTFRLDFFVWAEEALARKRECTRIQYRTAVRSFASFLGRDELDINEISKRMILDFVSWYDSRPKLYYSAGQTRETDKMKKGSNSAYRQVAMLSWIFQEAKRKYNDEDTGVLAIPRSPFDNLDIHFLPSVRHRNVGQEVMQEIISWNGPDLLERRAIDLFVVSFGLMGANLADLWKAAPQEGTWIYRRSKTEGRRSDGAEMRVEIPEVLRPYLERLGAGTDPVWWLPVLHTWKAVNYATGNINRKLGLWCEKQDLERMTFYAARHTWATLARKAGVEKATIDECLAHKGDFCVTDIYTERNWDLINEANRKVLSLFTWPD